MTQLTRPVTEADHYLGLFTAPVTLVEYGDYQCAICGRFQPLVKQLQAHFGSRLRIVFRHFPLKKTHPLAFEAACAAEAAAHQQRFWEMHAEIYRHQKALDEASLEKYAQDLGLNLEQFRLDKSAVEVGQRIEDSFIQGVLSGVNGTPCFFIQGSRYDGDPSFDALVRALDAITEVR
jgi:protein-disulfide isomerase